MMDLATYMVYATCTVFGVGALAALVWSITAGQWKDLDSAKCLVFTDDTEVTDA